METQTDPTSPTVTISVSGTDSLSVDTETVDLNGQTSPCTIDFVIQDAGYVFPTAKPTAVKLNNKNSFQSGYGITILGAATDAFGLKSGDWSRSSDGRTVTITAQNKADGATYSYMITVSELASGRLIALDPRIADRQILNRSA